MMATKAIFTGKVKFFNDSKGYGFIKDDVNLDDKDIPKEYFFHFTGMLDKVGKDDNVEFELQQGEKGLKAINIIKRVV